MNAVLVLRNRVRHHIRWRLIGKMSVRIEHVIVIHAISFQSRIILVLLYLFVLILGHFASFRALSYVIKISEFENRRRGSTLNQIL